MRGSKREYVLTKRNLEEVIERFRKRVEEEGEPSELAKASFALEVTPALIAVWRALYEKRLREKHVLWAASGIHILFFRGDSIEIRPFSEYLLNGLIASGQEGFELRVLKRSVSKGAAAKALKELIKESTGIPKARVEIGGWKAILLGVRWRVRFSLGEGGGEFLISDFSDEEVMDWPPIGEKKAIEIARREASILASRRKRARRSAGGVRIVRSWDSLFVERKGFRAKASLLDEDEKRYLLIARSDERRFLLELSKLTGRVLGHREVPTEEEIEGRIVKAGKDLGIELKIEKELFHEGILQLRASDEKGWYSLLFVCDSNGVKLHEIEVTSTGVEEMLRLFSEDVKAKVISHAYSKGLLKISGEGREGRYSLLIDISKPGEPRLLDFKIRKGLLDRIRRIFLK